MVNKSMPVLHTSFKSETGRRPRNEDACGHWTSEGPCCWVVSDGAGGHGSGDVASQLVVSTMLSHFSKNAAVTEQTVVDLLANAHAAVMSQKRQDPKGDDMHATAAVLLIDAQSGIAHWGHVGDTRIYLFRHRKVMRQTRDHSLVQNLIDAGYGTADIIRSHPQRSLLTAAIGNNDELAVSVSGAPVQLEEGDLILICTDGWWEHVEEDVMESMLDSADDVDEWLRTMARRVESRAEKHSDNYTALVVQVGELEPVITVLLHGDSPDSPA